MKKIEKDALKHIIAFIEVNLETCGTDNESELITTGKDIPIDVYYDVLDWMAEFAYRDWRKKRKQQETTP